MKAIAFGLALAVSLAAAGAGEALPEGPVKERAKNLNEAKVKPYVLEDVLTFADGAKVTRETWPRRRKELLDVIARELFGSEPPKPEAL